MAWSSPPDPGTRPPVDPRASVPTAPTVPNLLPPPPPAPPEPVVFTGEYGSAPPYAPEGTTVSPGAPPPQPVPHPDPYATPFAAPTAARYADPYADPHAPTPGPQAPVWSPPGAQPTAWAPPAAGFGAIPPGPPVVPPGPPVRDAGWPPFANAPTAVAVVPKRRSPAGWVAALVIIVAFMAGSLAFVAAKSTTPTFTAAPPVRTVPTAPTNPNGSSGGSPSSDPSSWADVAAAVNPGVVNIESRLPQGIGAGTGIVLTADGRILTNNHVVEDATEIQVTVAATGEFYDATIVGTDPSHDVAVLQLADASGLATIPLGDSDGVQVSDPVAAIGNAGGRGGTPQIVTGKVVALHTSVTASDQDGSNVETLTDMIQVDAKVVPGDSGGPLADEHGKVIGINTAASASSAGSSRGRTRTATPEGYAIPINRALQIAEQLAKGGSAPTTTPRSSTPSSNRGYIGVEVSQGTTGTGATVSGVKAGSGAQKAGLKAGDVITEVDGTTIETPTDLTAALSGKTAGTKVDVTWETSSGDQQQATITLQAG